MPEIETRELDAEPPKPPPPEVRSAQRRPAPEDSAETGKNPPREAPTDRPAAARPLPRPPKFNMKPGVFFEYWSKQDHKYPDRILVYVYRTWPVIDRQAVNPEHKKYMAVMEESFEDPGEWAQEMLHRFGSGNYKLIATDAGGTTKTLGQTAIRDLRDTEYPPWIEDMNELVMDDPSNQSYIEGLRQKGLLAGENEMAAGEAITTLAKGMKDLATQMATDKKESVPAPPPQTPAEVMGKSLDMAKDAFKSGMDLSQKVTDAQLKTAQDQAAAAEARVKQIEAQSNPSTGLGVIKEVAGVIKDLLPSPRPEAPATTDGQPQSKLVDKFMERVDQLQAQILKMQEDRISGLERTISDIRSQAAPAHAAPAEDFTASLEKLAKMKDTFQTLFGGGEEEAKPEKVPVWLQVAQAALGGLPAVATSLLAMSYNMAVAKTGEGKPIPPVVQPGPEAEQPTLLPAAGAPAAAPGPGDDAMKPIILGFLRQIEKPLINHLNDPEATGVDFAEWVTRGYGDIGYQSAKTLGKDTLMTYMLSYPPIGNVIRQIPERANQFIDEFLAADEEAPEEPPEPGPEPVAEVVRPTKRAQKAKQVTA